MFEAARAAKDAGGTVVGIITEALMAREVGNHDVSELHVVQTMHARKAMMAERSDAFVILPGGYGTFDELCEMLTWNQLVDPADAGGAGQPRRLLRRLPDAARARRRRRAAAARITARC